MQAIKTFDSTKGLYVTGRRKELMIVRGRNIYPYDIERTVTEPHEHFQKCGCAVFSLAKEQGGEEVRKRAEQLVVTTLLRNLWSAEHKKYCAKE